MKIPITIQNNNLDDPLPYNSVAHIVIDYYRNEINVGITEIKDLGNYFTLTFNIEDLRKIVSEHDRYLQFK
jgi:hypothetical protein